MESSQLPPDEPGPGESQADYERRVGPLEPAAEQPIPGGSPALQGPTEIPAAEAPVGSLAGDAPAAPPALEITHREPLLAPGAVGGDVERLVRLLAAAGYAGNTVANAAGAHAVLDASVMADVNRLWADHPEAREGDELFQGREGDPRELKGSWIGPNTWQALYNLAAARG